MTDRPLEEGFWWSHWGHLLTKPLTAGLLWAVLHWQLPIPLPLGGMLGVRVLHLLPPVHWATALLLPILVPAVYSLVRKELLWPGCLTRETAVVLKDEFADAWAAGILVVPVGLGDQLPEPMRIALGVAMLLWLLLFLHRWALP